MSEELENYQLGKVLDFSLCKENVSEDPMPVRVSEDFAFFTQEKPGAFFFMGSGLNENSPMIHSNEYDFNDDIIDLTSQFWMKLALDRLYS